MRRIGSKHLEEKRRRRNQIIVGLILIFVMFFSVLGFGFQGGHSGGVDPATNPNKGNSNERINYNGFEFTEQNGFWILNKDNTNFIFRFNPNQVEKIDSELKPLANYESKPLYFNSENVLAESEIRTNLAQFVEKMQSACLEEECDESSQIRTCENNFIIIREGSKKISQEGNCVFIEGKTDDLTKLTDEFLFKILGIEG